MLDEDCKDEDYKISARQQGTRKQILAPVRRHHVQGSDVDSIWKAISQLTEDVRNLVLSLSTSGPAHHLAKSRNAKCWICGKPGQLKRNCIETSRQGMESGAD